MFKPVFLCRFLVRKFFAQILVPVFVQIFGAQIFAQIFGAQIFFDVVTLWRFKNRCSRVTQKCAENLQKNLRRRNGPARGGCPIPSLLSRADSTSHNRRQAHALKESM